MSLVSLTNIKSLDFYASKDVTGKLIMYTALTYVCEKTHLPTMMSIVVKYT